jgi:hypothetical protein
MRSGGKGDAIPLIKYFEMPRPVGGELHFIHFIFWKRIQPSPPVKRVIEHKSPYLTPLSSKLSIRWLPRNPSVPVINVFCLVKSIVKLIAFAK